MYFLDQIAQIYLLVSDITLSDLRNITGVFKRKNNWLFPFCVGYPIGTVNASELNECKFINSE